MSRKSPKRNTGLVVALILLILVFIAGSALMIKLSLDLADSAPSTRPGNSSSIVLPNSGGDTTAETEPPPPETTLPEPEHVVSTATIVSTGDQRTVDQDDFVHYC